MKTLRLIALLAITALTLGTLVAQQPKQPAVKVIDQKQFVDMLFNPADSSYAPRNTRTAVVDFNAVWCGPCRKLAPILDSLAVEMPDVDFYSLDVDKNKDLARSLGVTNIPMLLICPAKGQPQAIVGLYPKEEIQKVINYVENLNQ